MSNATHRLVSLLTASLAAAALLLSPMLHAQESRLHANARAVVEHWTPARLAAATPRDMVIDERGLGYLRRPDGSLVPHGHSIEAQAQAPRGKTAGGGDTQPPDFSNMSPADGATLTSADQLFSAKITDASGIKSASFVITYPSGTTQSFSANRGSDDFWTLQLNGFSGGIWGWHVVAKDRAKPGNTGTSAPSTFTVDLGGDTVVPPGDNTVTTNAPWGYDGAVQTAAGRIYFEMPTNTRVRGKPRLAWNAYVCSGTVATDDTTGRSVIITAAHCVYEDVEKKFARKVLFIPNQDATTGGGTDTDCSNDPLGCWAPTFGVVDTDWTTDTFPANIPWDYAYYVVEDSGAHSGKATTSEALDVEAGSLDPQFTAPTTGDVTHALGYSYSDDPNFMYCAEAMTTEGSDNWWLPNCGLSGGSSGGPWVQPMDTGTGNGPIISVNSWGYTNSPGMAGPVLSGTTAECLFDKAKSTIFANVSTADGEAGVVGCY